MKTDLLKNSEIFIFLSLVFSIFTAVLLTGNAKFPYNGKGLEECKDSLNGYKKAHKECKDSLNGYKIAYKECQDLLNRYKKKCDIDKDSLQDILKYVNKTPPHIEIDGTQNVYFQSGEARILSDFEIYLKDSITPILVKNLQDCPKCNAMYIVGHTDDKNVGNWNDNDNFDADIVNVINGYMDVNNVSYNSNTDLGLLRAVSIYNFFKNQKGLENIKYCFPYSAGPLINPETSLLIKGLDASNGSVNQKKRRIEIWLYAYKSKVFNR